MVWPVLIRRSITFNDIIIWNFSSLFPRAFARNTTILRVFISLWVGNHSFFGRILWLFPVWNSYYGWIENRAVNFPFVRFWECFRFPNRTILCNLGYIVHGLLLLWALILKVRHDVVVFEVIEIQVLKVFGKFLIFLLKFVKEFLCMRSGLGRSPCSDMFLDLFPLLAEVLESLHESSRLPGRYCTQLQGR